MSLKGLFFILFFVVVPRKSNVRRRKMERDFLKKLGLDDQVTEKVMTQYGKDVQQLKDTNAELQSKNEGLNEQLSSRDKQLKDLKKTAGDNEELQAKLDKLLADGKEQAKQYENKLVAQKKSFAVSNALRDAGAKNPKTVEALLDLEKVSLDDNGQLIGINDQIENIKKSDGYLFGLKDDKPRVDFGAQGNPSNSTNNGEKSIVETIRENMEKGK